MSAVHDLLARTAALLLIGLRITVCLAIAPQWVLDHCGDGYGALVGCSLSVAAYAWSVFVFQRIESRLFYQADWKGAKVLLRQRFSRLALPWHRDLLLLCSSSGLFGAGVGWNAIAVTNGSLTDARIIAAFSLMIPFGVVVWLYRGTHRYRLDLPATDS